MVVDWNSWQFEWKVWGVVLAVMMFQWVLEYILNRFCKMQVRITLDVLENLSSVSTCKECIRNIFTNLAIVAALIMTIAFAMLFMTDHLYQVEEDEENYESNRLLAHAYVSATGYACIQSMRAMVEAVLNLIYTEALSSPEVVRFLIEGSGAIGAPVLATIFSIFSILFASTLYVLMVYSVPAGVAFGFLAASRLIAIMQFWLKRAKFTTDRKSERSRKWMWAEDPSSPPPASIARKCTEFEIEVMRRRASEAKASEEEYLLVQQSASSGAGSRRNGASPGAKRPFDL